MDLDALLYHYFGTDDPERIEADAFETGQEQLAVDFGTERDASRRFALWALMLSIGIAPEPAKAFKDARERMAAEAFLRMSRRAEQP